MNKLSMTPFEENLYVLSASTGKIRKFRQTSFLTAILFCGLFLSMLFTMPVNFYVVLVFAAYAVFKTLEILRFASVIATYRGLSRRIFERLAERTGDNSYHERAERLASGVVMERFLRTNILLLSVFYVLVLGSSFVIFKTERGILYTVSFSSVAFVLLSLRLQLSAANAVEEFKHTVFENGRRLKELTYGSK